jgi:hypothetical protein
VYTPLLPTLAPSSTTLPLAPPAALAAAEE